MSIPEPLSFNGAPGEVYGDDRRDDTPILGGYRCLDCAWIGRDAYAHHYEQHHRIVFKLAPKLVCAFSCCKEAR